MVGGVFEDGFPNRRPHRVTMHDVLSRLLDRIEAVYDVLPADGERGALIPTGILELDVVLGGGVAVGEVVVIAADSALQRRALTATIARSCPNAGLYAVDDPVALGRLMVAGASDVPEVFLRTAQLTVRDWDDVNQAIYRLAQGDVYFTAAPTLATLRAACDGFVPVLVVDEAQRFGPIGAVASEARRLADDRMVAAVLITDDNAERVQDAVGPTTRVIAVASNRLDSRATFVDPATFTVTRAAVGTLAGQIGTTDDALR